MSVNKVILLGNVGKDPEVRYIDKNVSVANFSLATTERGFTMQNGTVVPDRTEWHNIVAWRGLADIAEKYIRKGTQIYVEGKLQTRSWEKDGIKRYTTEIVADSIELLGRKGDSSAPALAPQASNEPMPEAPSLSATEDDDDSPLPF